MLPLRSVEREAVGSLQCLYSLCTLPVGDCTALYIHHHTRGQEEASCQTLLQKIYNQIILATSSLPRPPLLTPSNIDDGEHDMLR